MIGEERVVAILNQRTSMKRDFVREKERHAWVKYELVRTMILFERDTRTHADAPTDIYILST